MNGLLTLDTRHTNMAQYETSEQYRKMSTQIRELQEQLAKQIQKLGNFNEKLDEFERYDSCAYCKVLHKELLEEQGEVWSRTRETNNVREKLRVALEENAELKEQLRVKGAGVPYELTPDQLSVFADG